MSTVIGVLVFNTPMAWRGSAGRSVFAEVASSLRVDGDAQFDEIDVWRDLEWNLVCGSPKRRRGVLGLDDEGVIPLARTAEAESDLVAHHENLPTSGSRTYPRLMLSYRTPS